jgi:hypothetical protein
MNKTREFEVNEALMMGFQAALLGFNKVAFREQLAQEVEAAGYLEAAQLIRQECKYD